MIVPEGFDKRTHVTLYNQRLSAGLSRQICDDCFKRFATLEPVPNKRAGWVECSDQATFDVEDGGSVLIGNRAKMSLSAGHGDSPRCPGPA